MARAFLGSIFDSVRKLFYDNFAGRTNTTGSLGIATDGSLWNAVNQTIQVTSAAAKATTIPSSGSAGTTYPMATVNMPTANNVIKLSGTNSGSGTAIWVQSSSDWWLVNAESVNNTVTNYASSPVYTSGYSAPSYYYAFTSISGYHYTTTYAQGANYVANYIRNTYSIKGSGYYAAFSTQTTATAYYYYSGAQLVNGGYDYSSYTVSSLTYATTGNYYTYAAGSTTTNNQYLKIKKSVASVVTEMSSQLVSTTQTIASFLVSITGNVITARAYSDNLVTQIGTDLVYTATGATVTTQYGIALSPSTSNQSDIIGTTISITRN